MFAAWRCPKDWALKSPALISLWPPKKGSIGFQMAHMESAVRYGATGAPGGGRVCPVFDGR
jgi:hypothetical protein